MLIPSGLYMLAIYLASLSRRVNANSQRNFVDAMLRGKLIKKGEC